MSRKTPAHVIKLLEQFEERMLHFEEVLRVKTTIPEENQANYIREKSFDYWYGVIDGVITSMETTLFGFNCYNGFYYVDSKRQALEHVPGKPIQENPEYRNWRIKYYIKS